MEIDYVITWVDGSDPNHIKKRQQFPPNPSKYHKKSYDINRFDDCGEIYYQIASIIKYAPFVRRIHLVTPGQTPKLLNSFVDSGICKKSFFNIVHQDSLFEGLNANIPIFNSLTVEAVLWKIQGLSEYFIYANDDYFINAPIEIEDFFIDKKPVLYGEWKLINRRRQLKRLLRKLILCPQTKPRHIEAQSKGASKGGAMWKYLYIEHMPHALRKSVIESFYENNINVLQKQVGFRYRSIEQYHPISLSNQLEIKHNNAVIKSAESLALSHPEEMHLIEQFYENIKNENTLFGCMQYLCDYPNEVQRNIHNILQEKFSEVLPDEISKSLIE